MRQKVKVDGSKSDHELFKELPLGDLWKDAGLASVCLYLMCGRSLVIPDAWHDTMMDLKKELEKHANWLHVLELYKALQYSNYMPCALAQVVTAADLRAASC